MLDILIYLAVFVIICALVWWLLQQMELPEPLAKAVRVAFVVIAVIVLIMLMLNFVGQGPSLRLR
jgi:hypothetical protein